jgi:uncharacterized iron-regulated membrane protein
MYEKQVTAWADGYRVTPTAGATRLAVDELLRAAAASRTSGTPTGITLQAEPTAPASVSFGREGTVFVDPYTGAVLGEGSKATRAFFRSVTDWHRWLATDSDNRATGRAITGASNLLFLFVVLSGLVIWWPRSWTAASLKSVVFFRGGLAGKARDFNWHNVVGFWSALPLALIVATAVVMSYPWANDLLYRAAGTEPPPRPATTPTPAAAQGDRRLENVSAPARESRAAESAGVTTAAFAGLDSIVQSAATQAPDWRTLTLRFAGPSAPVTVSVDTSTGAQRPDLRSTLTFDRATGALTKSEAYSSQTRGRQWRAWARWIHTGEAFGLPGQTIAGLVSLGSLLLAWTGVALTWRRFRAWRARRVRSASAPAINEAVGV